MSRHGGASQYHDGALTNKARTRRARKNRGQKRESMKALRKRQRSSL